MEAFRRQHANQVEEALKRRQLEREPWWSESVAIGSPDDTGQIKKDLCADGTRKRLENEAGAQGAWILREASEPYGAKTG